MRKYLILLVLAFISALLAGCATLTETPKERQHRIDFNMKRDWKMAVDDWDCFWMTDEPSRLSRDDL